MGALLSTEQTCGSLGDLSDRMYDRSASCNIGLSHLGLLSIGVLPPALRPVVSSPVHEVIGFRPQASRRGGESLVILLCKRRSCSLSFEAVFKGDTWLCRRACIARYSLRSGLWLALALMSLINFISKWDPLPDDWELRGRSHSVDQVRSLEEHLEAIYGLVPPTQQGGYRRRLSHPGHAFPVSSVDCASSRDSLLENGARGSSQRENQESTRATMKAFAGSCIAWCREKYGKVAQMISNGISIMVSSYHSSSRLRIRQSPTLFQHLTFIVEEVLSFAGGVISTSHIYCQIPRTVVVKVSHSPPRFGLADRSNGGGKDEANYNRRG